MGQMSHFNSQRKDIWRSFTDKSERRMAPSLVKRIEEFTCSRVCDCGVDELDSVPDEQNAFLEALQAYLHDLLLPVIQEPEFTQSPELDATEASHPSKPKPKSLDDRLYIMAYVGDHLTPELMTPEGRMRRGVWPKICADWNRDHLSDKVDSRTLAKRYLNAKADRNVQFNLAVDEVITDYYQIVLPNTRKALNMSSARRQEIAAQENAGLITHEEADRHRQEVNYYLDRFGDALDKSSLYLAQLFGRD